MADVDPLLNRFTADYTTSVGAAAYTVAHQPRPTSSPKARTHQH